MHTGSRAFCILMALAATGTEAATASAVTTTGRTPVQPGHYRVEAKIISVSAAAAKDIAQDAALGYFSDEKVGKLMQSPGVSALSFPSVDANESFPAHINVTRNIALPHGPSHETGINLDIVPQKQGADIGFQVSIKDVRFQGFQDKTATIPLFHTGRVTTSIPADAQAGSGYYCVSVPAPKKVAMTYDADGRRSASIADANERELLFVKISRG